MDRDTGLDLSKKTVFIIDDNEELCSALQWLFESVHLCVKTFHNAFQFLEAYDGCEQGCLITDVRLPGMSGIELLETLKSRYSILPIVVITGYGDIPMALRAMKAGAVDFVLKPINEQCLIEIVQKCLMHPYTQDPLKEVQQKLQLLTEREHQVMQLIMQGTVSKAIATALSVSVSTVEAHRAHIMQKMQAKNLAQLIRMYLQGQIKRDLMYNRIAFYQSIPEQLS